MEELTKIKHKKTGEIKFFSGSMGARKFIQDQVLPNRKTSNWFMVSNK